jgi:rRNA-processing protein FCF1
MLNVLLDTNILHEEGLNSTRVQRIQRLIKSNDLKLIVPEMVVNEFKSKRIEQANSNLDKIQSALDNLQRKNITSKDSRSIKQAVNYISSSINQSNDQVDKWMEENNVDIYKISNTSIEDIFVSYFAGTGAFRHEKKREDIPDAVIYDGIVNISKDTKISVVVKDGALLNAISELDNVESFSSLSQLLELPLLKGRIEELDNEESKVKSILDLLGTFDGWYEISTYLDENELVEVENHYDGDFIDLPYDLKDIKVLDQEVQVRSIGDIFLSSPNYLGNKKFSLSMNLESKADLSFYCEEEQYELLPYVYRKTLTKELSENRDEVHVYGGVDVILQGVVVLENIDENTEASELQLHLSYLGADRCEIKCSVEIESIEVNDIY